MPHFSAWYKNWGFFHQSPPQKKINSAPEWIKYNFHFSVLWCLCFSLLHPFSAILFLLLLCRQEKWLPTWTHFFSALSTWCRESVLFYEPIITCFPSPSSRSASKFPSNPTETKRSVTIPNSCCCFPRLTVRKLWKQTRFFLCSKVRRPCRKPRPSRSQFCLHYFELCDRIIPKPPFPPTLNIVAVFLWQNLERKSFPLSYFAPFSCKNLWRSLASVLPFKSWTSSRLFVLSSWTACFNVFIYILCTVTEGKFHAFFCQRMYD